MAFKFKGIAKGITEGGVFEPVLSVILVRCTPARLPKVFLLDISHLQLDEAILVKDLKLPEGVKVLNHRPDDHVAHCVPQKVVVLETPTAATDGASPAEPERIGGKKPEDEAAAPADGAKAAAAPKADKKDEKKDAKK